MSSGVSQAEKDEIVRVHNEFRSRLASGRERRGRPGPQPSATDMEQMVSGDLNERRPRENQILQSFLKKCFVIIYPPAVLSLRAAFDRSRTSSFLSSLGRRMKFQRSTAADIRRGSPTFADGSLLTS